MAAVLFSSVSFDIGIAGTAKAGSAPRTNPRLDMVRALKALGPHPSLGDQIKLFGLFVRTWDVEYTDYSKDGTVTHRSRGASLLCRVS